MAWIVPFGAGLAFAMLMIGAFPPLSLWGCSLLALAPLAWLAERTAGAGSRGAEHGARSALRPAVFAAIGAAPFYAVMHAWLWDVAGPGMPVLVVLMSLFPLAFVWLLIRARRRWPRVPVAATAPVLWAGLEFFRGTIAFDGYPWYFVGHPLIDFAWAAEAATTFGAMGVSFGAASVGVWIGWVAARPSPRRAGVAAAMAAGLAMVVHAAGLPSRLAVRTFEPVDTFLRVGIVQTNLPQSNKMAWSPEDRVRDLLWFLELTDEAAGQGEPGLIVWPETMFPGSSLDEQSRRAEQEARIAWFLTRPDGSREALAVGALADALLERQEAVGIPMVVGAIAKINARYTVGADGSIELETDHLYNSAYAIHEGRVIGRYDKVHLTPFGEVMPYISAWPWLERRLLGFAAAGMSFDLSASDDPRILEVPARPRQQPRGDSDERGVFERSRVVRLATPICFESTNPDLCRRLVNLARRGARNDGWDVPALLVNPTNDGWFGGSNATREQHLQLARWRAVENRIAIVRAANTGISCAIDHRGRILARGVRGPTDPPGHRGPSSLADGVLVAELPLVGGRTIYSRTGDWLGWIVLVAAGGVVIMASWPGTRAGRKAKKGKSLTSDGR